MARLGSEGFEYGPGSFYGKLPDWAPDFTHMLGFQSPRERFVHHDSEVHRLAVEYGRTHDGLIYQRLQELLEERYGIEMDGFDWAGFADWYAETNG